MTSANALNGGAGIDLKNLAKTSDVSGESSKSGGVSVSLGDLQNMIEEFKLVLSGRTVHGGEGSDSLQGGWGNDKIQGGSGEDRIKGNDGDDTLFGERGDDSIIGGAGSDKLIGGEGNDYLSGDSTPDEGAADTLWGGEGNDYVSGGWGDDKLHGGSGEDRLDSGDGDDVLFGQDGDDRINGGEGDDYLSGGRGRDTFEIRARDGGEDTISDFTKDDFITVTVDGPPPMLMVMPRSDIPKPADVEFIREGDDVLIRLGDGPDAGSVRLKDALAGGDVTMEDIEERVTFNEEQLVGIPEIGMPGWDRTVPSTPPYMPRIGESPEIIPVPDTLPGDTDPPRIITVPDTLPGDTDESEIIPVRGDGPIGVTISDLDDVLTSLDGMDSYLDALNPITVQMPDGSSAPVLDFQEERTAIAELRDLAQAAKADGMVTNPEQDELIGAAQALRSAIGGLEDAGIARSEVDSVTIGGETLEGVTLGSDELQAMMDDLDRSVT